MDYYELVIMFISTARLHIQIIPYYRQMINVTADSREKEISL
jgi:hypothetical protein